MMVELMRAKGKDAILTINDSDKANKITHWCLSSESDSRVFHSLHMATFYMPRKREEFETDIYLFGVRNGVINLRINEFKPARPQNYLLRNTDIDYDPMPSAPHGLKP